MGLVWEVGWTLAVLLWNLSGRLGGKDHFGRAVGGQQLEDKAEGQRWGLKGRQDWRHLCHSVYYALPTGVSLLSMFHNWRAARVQCTDDRLELMSCS